MVGAAEVRRVGDHAPIQPETVIADLREALAPDDIVISDVGAHKVWLSRLFPTERPGTVVISNGLASMGIALPGAIAAKLVHPERKVVAFSGDGGFLMNVQELETAKRIGTAIVVVVLVDERLGVIEANEKRTYRRTFATAFGNPDFVELARAFGIAGYAVESAKDLVPTLRRGARSRRPVDRRGPLGSHRERADRGGASGPRAGHAGIRGAGEDLPPLSLYCAVTLPPLTVNVRASELFVSLVSDTAFVASAVAVMR